MITGNDVEETAKAVQEVAKASGKGIDASRDFCGFITKFISGSLEQGMGIFEDKLKYIRWERQQRLMTRVKKFAEEYNVVLGEKTIPLKLAVPFFQGATLEEDNDLQDIWAKLLINSSNQNSGVELKRIYMDILERVTPFDAKVFSKIYSFPFEEIENNSVITAKLPQDVSINFFNTPNPTEEPSEEVKITLANLASLNCILLPWVFGGVECFRSVNVTLIGKNFIDACTLKPQ